MSSSRAKAAAEVLVAGVVGQHAQFDLRIVGRQQDPAPLPRHKGRADLPAGLGPHGDVLQVRVAGAEAPGRGHGLMERGVDAARAWMDHLRQGVHVRPLELRVLAVLDDLRRQRVRPGRAPPERRRRCWDRSSSRERTGSFCSVEQDLLELLGRGDVERMPGQGVDLLLQRLELAGEPAAQFGQAAAVHADAVVLQLHQHLDQRHLHFGEERHPAPLAPGVGPRGAAVARPGGRRRRHRGRPGRSAPRPCAAGSCRCR